MAHGTSRGTASCTGRGGRTRARYDGGISTGPTGSAALPQPGPAVASASHYSRVRRRTCLRVYQRRAGSKRADPFNGMEYTGGTSISVSPLLLAVAARNMNVVSMLISFGARLDLPQNSLAVCLAQDIGEEDIAEAIERYGGVDVSPDCAERRSNAPTPLLRWIE